MSEDKKENEEENEEEKKEEYRSLTTRDILGSSSSKKGLALLALAVLCAFVSIHQEVDTSHDRGVLNGDGDESPETIKLEQKRSILNSTLQLKFNSSSGSSTTITISDFKATYNRSLEVEEGVEKEFDLRPEHYWLKYNLTRNETLSYHQKTVYSHSPYRILTIPAFILTVAGIVIFYKGKYSIKKEKQLERAGKEEREKMEKKDEEKGGSAASKGGEKEKSKEPRKQFMGVDWGDIDEGEEISRKDEEKR